MPAWIVSAPTETGLPTSVVCLADMLSQLRVMLRMAQCHAVWFCPPKIFV
jgi:hypothetical protein